MRGRGLLLTATATGVSVLAIFFSVISRRPEVGKELWGLQLLQLPDGAKGPESLAFDREGSGPYVGVDDGRILKWRGKEQGWAEFATTRPPREDCKGSHGHEMEHICGRPLGLRFNDETGELYIADAYFGLLVVGADGGQALPLITQAQGIPFTFTNAIDIDQETGVVYFTDSSSMYHRRKFLSLTLTGDRTGRVIKYDPRNKETEVLMSNMSAPNGVALSKDGSFLLVAESSKSRIIKFWLKTQKAGSSEVFVELPGFPDNIRRSPSGDFWVAIFSRRTKFIEWFLSYPLLGKLVVKVVPLNLEKWYGYIAEWRGSGSLALKVSEEGKILESFGDREGKTLKFVSEVDEMHGHLWIGTLTMPHIGVQRL